MTTLLPESTAEADAIDPPTRSRRGRRLRPWLIGVIVVVLVVAGAWLLVYQPLLSGAVAGVQADTYEVHENILGSEYRIIAPEPGETISMWLGLRNDGPFGVTIVQVGQPFNRDGIIDTRMSAETTGVSRLELMVYPPGERVPMSEPFSLAPGMGYEAILSFDILDCATVPGVEDSRTWATSVPVTYRVLGMTRTVDLDIGYAISLEAAPTCPSP